MRSRFWELGLFVGLAGLCLGFGTPAHATTTQVDTPFSLTIIDPCTGELVDVRGVSHTVIDFPISSSGNFVMGVHSNEHDVTGVGETTQTSYKGTGTSEMQSFQGTVPTTLTFGVNTELIAQGSAPNFDLHTLVHLTSDAQGNVTSTVDNFSATCQ